MSKEWEEYKKAKAKSDKATAETLMEIDRKRLVRQSGEATARDIMSKPDKKK